MKAHGIFPPLTTPFAPDGSVAFDRLSDNVEQYNRTRVAGYVVVGSTGESVLLSRQEIERIWETVRAAAGSEKILIAGTGVDSTAETIARTNRAAEIGYHVALVKTPYYYKPQMTPDVEAEHFLRVADAAKIPLLLYSVPQFTGVALEAPLVARLAQHPNIVGIKESSGNVQRVTEIIASSPENFQTLVGSASTVYASLVVGAVGAILAAACFVPDLCVDLFEAAKAGDSRRAAELQHRLLGPAVSVVGKLGIPGIKYAMDQSGYYGGPPRRPLLPIGESGKRDVDAVLSALTAATPSD